MSRPEATPVSGAAAEDLAPGAIVKRSIGIAGHRTSISLEEAFWQALRRIAAGRGVSLAALVAEIDRGRGEANLSSAIRVYILRATEAGQE